jgi:hypothetical protein
MLAYVNPWTPCGQILVILNYFWPLRPMLALFGAYWPIFDFVKNNMPQLDIQSYAQIMGLFIEDLQI